MSAAFFAVAGALSFAFSTIFIRSAVLQIVDATAGILITVPIGIPFFLIILLANGQISRVASFSWPSYLWLAAAGILHFIVGRSLSYKCTQLVGANIANIIRRVSPLVAVILGLSLLRETLTWELAAGVLLIIGGVTLAGLAPQKSRSSNRMLSGIPRRAILFGLGAGLSWGISPILVKIGLGDSGSPLAGVFISYSAATIVIGALLWNRNKRAALASMKAKTVGLFVSTGLMSSTAQLMRYTALSLAPVSVIAPLFSINPIFVLVLSFIFNRKLEVFNTNIIIGTIIVVIGSLLLI